MSTVDLWTHTTTPAAGMDLTGYSVEARDGGIGKVDDATYEAGSSFVVVDTGPWIFGKKVMLPAGVIQSARRRHRDGVRVADQGRDQELARVRRLAA